MQLSQLLDGLTAAALIAEVAVTPPLHELLGLQPPAEMTKPSLIES